MQLIDVNILVYAHRKDARQHARYKRWLTNWIDNDRAFGMADIVLSGFVRVVTHPRVFTRPSTTRMALEFASEIRGRENCVPVHPGERHWQIFVDLCRRTKAKGNEVADAYLAALAIESGCQWISADRGFERFPGLDWRHPLGTG